MSAASDARTRAKLVRILATLREELAQATAGDPYRLAYLHAAELDDPEVLDEHVRSGAGIADADPRRVAFLAWCAIDRGARNGHACVPLADVMVYVGDRTGGTREELHAGLLRAVVEGAIVSYRTAEKRKLLALAPVAKAEEAVALFVAERLDAETAAGLERFDPLGF